MSQGCWETHLVERRTGSQSQLYSLMTTQQGLKIVSPSPVTFAKLFRISRIQWHSSGEQLVLRNSLLKGAGSWLQGRSLCRGPRRAVDLAGD